MMRTEKLEQLIADIESQRGSASSSYSTEKIINEQGRLNKLYIRLINEFNETTSRCTRWLIGLTWVIAILTLVMVVKMFWGNS